MLKVWKTLTNIVGTVTTIGSLLIIAALIYDNLTKKPIGGSSHYEDEDDCSDFVDLDFDFE